MSNPDPVEETKNLPLGQRLEHTHWKVRMVAYEELAKKFAEAEDSNSHMFAEYSMCPFRKVNAVFTHLLTLVRPQAGF